jgi:hypothetical protein
MMGLVVRADKNLEQDSEQTVGLEVDTDELSYQYTYRIWLSALIFEKTAVKSR